jgi:hypothetical protein
VEESRGSLQPRTICTRRIMVSYMPPFDLRQGRRVEQIQNCKVCLDRPSTTVQRLTPCRKVILCASARQDYAAAREVLSKMSDLGKNEPITRYLVYKAALHSGESELGERLYPSIVAFVELTFESCGMSRCCVSPIIERCHPTLCLCTGSPKCWG